MIHWELLGDFILEITMGDLYERFIWGKFVWEICMRDYYGRFASEILVGRFVWELW